MFSFLSFLASLLYMYSRAGGTLGQLETVNYVAQKTFDKAQKLSWAVVNLDKLSHKGRLTEV